MSAIDNMSSVRPDLIEKVTGRAEYVTDLTVPGMLHGFVVRSPAIHARIGRSPVRVNKRLKTSASFVYFVSFVVNPPPLCVFAPLREILRILHIQKSH